MPIGNAIAASGVLRRNHYRAGLRTLLCEAQDTNRCPRSEDLSTWTKSGGTGTATGGQADPLGGTSAFKLDDQDGAIDVNWFSANLGAYGGASTDRGFSFFCKADTSAAADVGLRDETAATYRIRLTVTNTAGVITAAVQSGSGVVVAVLPATDAPGWYRVLVQVSAMTPGNTHKVYLRPAGQTGTNLGAMLFWGICAHDSAIPGHSYIQNNTAGSTQCDKDSLSLPWPVAPGTLSLYVKYRETGSQLLAKSNLLPSVRIATLLGSGGDVIPRIILFHPASNNVQLHVSNFTTTGGVSTSGLGAFAYGDTIEVFGWIYSDGSAQVAASINGAAPVISARSSALAGGLPSAWSTDGLLSSQKFYPGSVVNGVMEWITGGLFPGTFSMAELQALAGVVG